MTPNKCEASALYLRINMLPTKLATGKHSTKINWLYRQAQKLTNKEGENKVKYAQCGDKWVG